MHGLAGKGVISRAKDSRARRWRTTANGCYTSRKVPDRSPGGDPFNKKPPLILSARLITFLQPIYGGSRLVITHMPVSLM